MTDITPLTDMLAWKLLKGSHDWPGPDGGTCINEAAIVAAGLPYKSVRSAADCPPCFSPVVSEYLIRVNDLVEDGDRQRLIPFVTRLAGSADTQAVEMQRFEYIIIETVRRIVSSAMEAAGLHDQAQRCRAVTTAKQATAEAARAAEAAWAAWAARAAGAARAAEAAGAAEAARAARAAWAARAARAAEAAEAARAAEAQIVTDMIEIVNGALRIGKQADRIDTALIVERMDAIRRGKVVA